MTHVHAITAADDGTVLALIAYDKGDPCTAGLSAFAFAHHFLEGDHAVRLASSDHAHTHDVWDVEGSGYPTPAPGEEVPIDRIGDYRRTRFSIFPGDPRRTPQEIEALKRDWLADDGGGDWRIEDTEGFEAHRDELKAFTDDLGRQREERARQALRDETARIQRRANDLGCSVAVVAYLEGLEGEIGRLKNRLMKVEITAGSY